MYEYIYTLKEGSESNVVLVHTMKSYRGSGSTASLILNLGTGWTVANFSPSFFNLEKERLYLLSRRLVVSPGTVRTFWRKER
jgi:hypothetical protein